MWGEGGGGEGRGRGLQWRRHTNGKTYHCQADGQLPAGPAQLRPAASTLPTATVAAERWRGRGAVISGARVSSQAPRRQLGKGRGRGGGGGGRTHHAGPISTQRRRDPNPHPGQVGARGGCAIRLLKIGVHRCGTGEVGGRARGRGAVTPLGTPPFRRARQTRHTPHCKAHWRATCGVVRGCEGVGEVCWMGGKGGGGM